MDVVMTGEALPQPEAGFWLFLELWLEPGTACPRHKGPSSHLSTFLQNG